MSTERPRHLSLDSPTDEILSFYKEIGHRPSLMRWREEIPLDARRIWLEAMLQETFVHKIAGGLGLEHVKDLLPDELFIRLNDLIRRQNEFETKIKVLEEDIRLTVEEGPDYETEEQGFERQEQEDRLYDRLEGVEVRLFLLQEEYRRLIQDYLMTKEGQKTLAEFARRYFTFFETDQENVERFFEEQEKRVKQIMIHLVEFLQWRESKKSIGERSDIASRLKGVFIVGSSAIGPRLERYPKRQDDDLLLAFPKHLDLAEIELGLEDLQRVLWHPEQHKALTEAFNACPSVQALRQMNVALDVHAASLADANNPLRPSPTLEMLWMYVCGPHRFIPFEVDGSPCTDAESVRAEIVAYAIDYARTKKHPHIPNPE